MTAFSDTDILYMRRAISLARLGLYATSPNPMVGAVIVAEGKIIGEGYHQRYGGPHAEVNAIADAESRGHGSLLPAATIYVSLEPCAHHGKTPPCADLIVGKGIRRAVVACLDPYGKVNGKGVERLREAGVNTTVGCCEEEAKALNRKFFTAHTLRRPFISLKWAQSTDGFIDHARTHDNPLPFRFSSPLTTALAHRQRALHDAILVGSGTVIADNPTLTVRHWSGRNPLRVVIDRRHRLSGREAVFNGDAPTLSYDLPLSDVLADLYEHQNVTSLLVEGGTAILQDFIDNGLFDDIQIEVTSHILGNGILSPKLTKNVVHFSEMSFSKNKLLVFRRQEIPK